MPIKEFPFPLRLAAHDLPRAYTSAQEAFNACDYLFAARYSDQDPELRGCALFMLGNAVGGERIFTQHNIQSGKSFLYRAYGQWRQGNDTEALRLVNEGLAVGDMKELLERFKAIIEKKEWHLFVHGNTRNSNYASLFDFEKVPGVKVISSNHFPDTHATYLPLGQSVKNLSKTAKPFDLALVHDLRLFPVDIKALGAPVIVHCEDHEWNIGLLPLLRDEIDGLAVTNTSTALELGKNFQIPSYLTVFTAQELAAPIQELETKFARTQGRTFDILFTGGIINDLYRDKRQRILPLAHLLDKTASLKLHQGVLPLNDYDDALKKARFTPVSVRYANYWTGRVLESLAEGVINLVDEECGMPFMFSQPFSCLQTYRSDHALEDIPKLLRKEKEIRAQCVSEAPQLEAELASLYPIGEKRTCAYLRQMLFSFFVLQPLTCRATKGENSVRKTCPSNQPAIGCYDAQQMKLFREQSLPQDHARPADWIRHLLARALEPDQDLSQDITIVEKALTHHPNSLALRYTHALLLRRKGMDKQADEAFIQASQDEAEINDDDAFPLYLDRLHGSYGVYDARIRNQLPHLLASYVNEKNVWKSYAFSHRADLAIQQALAGQDEAWEKALSLAESALENYPSNNAAQRSYLRALYALSLQDMKSAHVENYLSSMNEAAKMDGRIFHDFAPMTIDLLKRQNRDQDASKELSKLNLFLMRYNTPPESRIIYPENKPLLERYNLPRETFIG